MKNYFRNLLFLLTLILLIHLINHASSNKYNIAGIKTNIYETDVSAFIGEYRFTLFGYTSPKALVNFTGLGIFDQTYADEKGYFEFKNRFSPFSPREACLTAQDQFGRLTSPVCLPPFPVDYNVEIGPVIMPPTLSLDKNDYWIGDQVILSGQTIPNTNVNLKMFSREKNSNLIFYALNLIFPPIEAFSFPNINTKVDEKGNFSIVFTSTSAKKFRLFAQTQFQSKDSPKSVSLTFKILPWWMIIVKFFGFLWFLIKSRLLEIIILIELLILLIYLLRSYFHPKNLAIVKKQSLEIVKYQKPERGLTNFKNSIVTNKNLDGLFVAVFDHQLKLPNNTPPVLLK